MHVAMATSPGGAGENEDWAQATPDLLVVVDGQTARTGTGCVHGVPWYARRLGVILGGLLHDPDRPMVAALADAIGQVAAEHPGCDLTHPGTPSAVLGAARLSPAGWEYLILGDVAVAASTPGGVEVHRDDRVDAATRHERAAALAHPVGSDARAAALVQMKHAEHAARNTPGGFWCAAADPTAAQHALTGVLEDPAELALLSDGAARLVDYGLADWPRVLELLEEAGPAGLLRRVRAAEATDPEMVRWPRTKHADDATVVHARLVD